MKKGITISFIISTCLFAQSNVYDLGSIEVIEKKDISQNYSVDFVNSQKIDDTNSKTITQALNAMPGVYIQNMGGRNDFGVRIRGFSSNRVPIFVDGIPVYVPYDGGTDLNRFTTYDVSEIVVSKGYTSPMFGANTIGGAVNIITKKPRKIFEGELGGSVFNGKGHEEYLTLGSNNGLFYGLVSLSNYQRDYFKVSKDFEASGYEDGGKRENSDSKDRKLNLKIGFTPNDTDEYALNYIFQKGKKGQPFDANEDLWGRQWTWPHWDKTSYYLHTKTAFGNHYLKTRFYYDKFFNEMHDFGDLGENKNPTKPKSISKYDDFTYGGFIEGDFAIVQNDLLKVFASYKSDNHKDIDSKNKGLDVKSRSDIISFGFENSWQINDDFTWVIGGNYDKNNIKKAQYRYGINPKKPDSIKEFEKQNTDAFNMQTALYFQAKDDLLLYASISKKSNMPTLKERYSSRFNQFLPNPSLKAEKSLNYELGGQYILNNSHDFKSTVFFTQAKDYIGKVDVPKQLPCDSKKCFQSQNVGEEEHYGFEFLANSKWLDNLSTSLSYTYINSKLKNTNQGNKVTNVPEHSFNAFMKYSPINKFSIIPSLSYESARYLSINGKDKNKAFTLMNLKISYMVVKGLELSGGINNIFDKNYFYTNYYPQEGRNFYLGAKYSF